MEDAECPVKEGDEMDVEITTIGVKGDGIVKVDGFTVFVPGTEVGDKVRIRINRVLPRYAFSEIINQ